MLKQVIGVTVPVVLLAPVAVPVIRGLTGIAFVGLSLFAVGAVVSKTVRVLSAPPKLRNPIEEPPFD
jgi:hypothetical protein